MHLIGKQWLCRRCQMQKALTKPQKKTMRERCNEEKKDNSMRRRSRSSCSNSSGSSSSKQSVFVINVCVYMPIKPRNRMESSIWASFSLPLQSKAIKVTSSTSFSIVVLRISAIQRVSCVCVCMCGSQKAKFQTLLSWQTQLDFIWCVSVVVDSLMLTGFTCKMTKMFIRLRNPIKTN